MQNFSPEWVQSAMGSSVVVWPPWPSKWLDSHHMDTMTVMATEYHPWICSVIAALTVGLAGIVPLLLIPTDHELKTSSGNESKSSKLDGKLTELRSLKNGLRTKPGYYCIYLPVSSFDCSNIFVLISGFSRWEATKAQMYTAGIGLMGALFTLFIGTSNVLGGVQVYILSFTAGGFLNIALVTVLPELLQEDRPAQSCAQLLCLLFGTLTMASVALMC
nr:uncharacterized protein LOC128687802 [Cherax quadricarinatus]